MATATKLQFECLPAKVVAPEPRPGSIPRTAVINRLRTSAGIPVVMMMAPAGYGKTTALSQWAERDGRACAWLSIDERDNDAMVLLRDIAAALECVEPFDSSLSAGLCSLNGSVWTTAVPRLAAAITARKSPFVLVLDNASRLRSPTALEVLSTLSEHLPQGSTMAFAGRSAVGLPLAAFRARGRLLEVGPEQLALNRSEALSLVCALGVDLNAGEVIELLERCEGWAAGLCLAALAAREYKALPAGDDRYLADYFRVECLASLPPDRLAFLRESSILEPLSAPLCDAVLGRGDAVSVLESIENDGLFLVPLDHHRGAFRYHGLFRDLLRSELARHEPERVAALHGRAADWFETHGDLDAAIEHAAATNDLDRVAHLVESLALPTPNGAPGAAEVGWLHLFEGRKLERYPVVALLGAWKHASQGRSSEARHWLAAAERSRLKRTLPDGSKSLLPWISLLRAALCDDGVEQMLADSQQALAKLPVASYWRPTALLLHGTALALRGDFASADVELAEAGEAETFGASGARAGAILQRAILASERGDLGAADLLAADAREADSTSPVDAISEVVERAVIARALLRHGDFEQAQEELAVARRLAGSLPVALPWLAVQARLELARAFITLRDPCETQAQLAEAFEILSRHTDLGVLGDSCARLQRELDELREARAIGEAGLTRAELRILPLLGSHLSFREIGDRLFVTRNTVKSQAISVYRKLGVSGRSEAIEKARQLGLIAGADPMAIEKARQLGLIAGADPMAIEKRANLAESLRRVQ